MVRGYGEMVDWLKSEIKNLGGVIQLEEKLANVTLVEDEDEGDGEDGSIVLTIQISSSEARTYEAPYTLLTLPLGVLKHSPPEFTPPTATRRQRAIERLGMGLLEKIVLVYETPWWAGTSPGAIINILIPAKRRSDGAARSHRRPSTEFECQGAGWTCPGWIKRLLPRSYTCLPEAKSTISNGLRPPCSMWHPSTLRVSPWRVWGMVGLCGENVTESLLIVFRITKKDDITGQAFMT